MHKIIRRTTHNITQVVSAAILLCTLSGFASAEIIDDISLKTDANGEVDAVIKFSVPVQYIRHFPMQSSPYSAIYFNILNDVPRDQWQNYESHRSPPSELIHGFTITTRDLSTGPKVEVQFNRPAAFVVTPDRTGYGLILHIKADKPQQKESKPAIPAGIAAPLVVPPVVAAAPIKTPVITAAIPGAALSASAVAITQPVSAQPAAAVPTATTFSSLPPGGQLSGSQPPTNLKTVHIALGGKDGLPAFPEIEQVAPETVSAPPAENLSLAEQIRRANNQAAILMAKGGNALLAADVYAAIDAFNSALNLPPNKYSPYAQLWIGIAREKADQTTKSIFEYESYLKLYPDGTSTAWVKDRIAKLKGMHPELVTATGATAEKPAAAKVQNTKLQTTEYGSISMYYYNGSSQTNTVTTTGSTATPTTLSHNDQSSLISNISATTRSYNNEFDNRLVFQDFYSANFLPGQKSQNRLNAIYFDVKNRISDYSMRIGRQSATGGGVLGRFDGVAAGYGFISNWRANVVSGRLSDATNGPKPVFYGASLDFGVNSQLGGSFYAINQTVGGIADRRAIGGNARYFDPKGTILTMLDYDTLYKDVNMATIQGTLNGDSGTNYNFLLDRRKTPTLSLRSAVNGTNASVDTLLQNGWTTNDLILLGKQRTAVSSMAQFGVTNQLKEHWQMGTDLTISKTSGLPESGTQFIDPLTGAVTTGLDGYVPGTPASGNTWTLSERLIGNNVLSKNGMTMYSLSYTKSALMKGESLLINNRSVLEEKWTVDETLRFYWQTDNLGGKMNSISPTLRTGYKLRQSLTTDAELGLDWTKSTPSTLQSSKSTRKFFSLGFRWDF
jgi:hypothetical protein